MRLQQIQAEWTRALKSLRAAETLKDHGLLEDAVSRAYYAVMHAAKSVLLVNDAVAESHEAVRRLFGNQLVRTGEVEKEWAHILSREQRQREIADYNIDAVIAREVAERMVLDARRFVERMKNYLMLKGIDMGPKEEAG